MMNQLTGETMKCCMLVGHRCDNDGERGDEIWCDAQAVLWHKSDHEHGICQSCYDKLYEDPDIQAEYEAIRS